MGEHVTRRRFLWPAVALAVLVIELGATLGTVNGEPFSPVAGWGPTRPADALAFAAVVLGCGALALIDRFPRTVAVVATGSYVVFALRDHELGMFLPPMVATFALAALTRHRRTAIVSALTSLAAAMIWVAGRTGTIADSGVALLGWVAFAAVLAVFFLVPLLIGEIVRTRSLLRAARSRPVAVLPPLG
ncbi:hypothetical protein [Ruania zhangjianzhongii]|uniref:hypothetical protein n=1 Tax=Ruania zhangjianzhongii TaxID=2603206 RepID=UPI0011C7290B|nr:hypothetical protein [Ruania zhangjianzhongii]